MKGVASENAKGKIQAWLHAVLAVQRKCVFDVPDISRRLARVANHLEHIKPEARHRPAQHPDVAHSSA